jgi:plasmid stabilization system protein ParE
MRRSYRISREARTDLLQIWNYLAERASFEVADKVITDLRTGMNKVSKSPGVGHERNDLTELPVRFYKVHRFLIVYAPHEKPLGIVRVLHASRDISAILENR